MSIGRIIVALEARTGSFETDTARAAKTAAKRSKEIDDAFRKAGAAIGVVAAGIAVAMGALVQKTINASDETSKAAQKIGVTTEALSALNYAAEMSGVTQEALAGSLVRLTKGMSDAARGTGDAKLAFDAMGLSVTTAEGKLKSSDQMLGDIAGKFSEYANGAEKTALAVAVFGRAGAEMIPMLNEGAEGIQGLRDEAAELGIVLDTETGKAAERFNDNVARLGKRVEGFGLSLARELLPNLEGASQKLVDTGKNTTIFETSVRVAAGVVKIFATGMVTLVSGLIAAGNALVAFGRAGKQALSGEFDEAWQTLVDGQESAVSAVQNGMGIVTGILNGAASNVASNSEGTSNQLAAPVMKAANKIKEATDKAAGYVDALRSKFDRMGWQPEQVARLDVGQAGGTEAQKDEAERLAKAIRVYEEGTRRASEVQSELARVFESTRTPAEKLAAEIQRLNELYDYGKKDWDTYARAMFAAQDAFDGLQNKVEETKTAMDEFAVEAARNIQDALGQGLYDVMSGNFDNIGDAFGDMLKRMAAEALAADLARSLFGDFAKSGKVGGIAGQLFSAIGGMFGGPRADGGPVAGGKTYLVGERGPELFTPNTSGAIVPNHVLGAGGKNVTINQSFTFNGATSRTEAYAIVQAARQQTLSDMQEASFRGESAAMGY